MRNSTIRIDEQENYLPWRRRPQSSSAARTQ